MSEHPPELVEKIAESLWAADKPEWAGPKRFSWAPGVNYGANVSISEECRQRYRRLARAALDAIAETHAVVDKALIARALAYGDSFRTPAAAGARAALREAAGMKLPRGTEAPD